MWKVQNKHKNNYEKKKVLDITLKPGQIAYIPAYWWYTIKFTSFSSICKFSYRTFMSSLANSPDLFMRLLQQQNVKRDMFEKIDVEKKEQEQEISS